MILDKDTIVAQATALGKGGVGIIRISGPLCQMIAKKIIGILPTPRYAHFCRFKYNNEIIDEGITLYFPAPHSFTGEDVLEFQGHGGPVLLDHLVKIIVEQGARIARPGEFSLRAFLNNKIDLAQAEAISDLINADSVQAARSAVRSLQGEFSQKIKNLTEELVYLRTLIEAAIDFPEEEIDFLADKDIENRLIELLQHVKLVLKTAEQGALLQEGMTIVIAGEPNAGKSSLLNCLSGKESAIVTPIAGTTRDILREHINIDGMPLHIIDTAGLRTTSDIVEQEGVRRAKQAIENADVVLLVLDSSKKQNLVYEINLLYKQVNLPREIPVIIVANKIDLIAENPHSEIKDCYQIIKLSAKHNQGIELLTEHLKKMMGFNQRQEGVFIARRRHLDALNRAHDLAQHGLTTLQQDRAGELVAEDLRLAQIALSEITGEFTADDLLGEIFSSFCIGK